MSSNRSHFRNVQFYDGSNPDVLLGGLVQNGSVTERNFLQMLGIILITETPTIVQHRGSGHVVLMSDSQLEVGSYNIYCHNDIQVNDQPWVQRVISFNVSGQEDGFRNGIRDRDGRCVISGVVNRSAPYRWTSFEAAHIFPSEAENLWIEWGYGRCITDMNNRNGVSKINSCQNGFLLKADVHQAFDQYLVSVNPDDNYKVVFDVDNLGVDGRILDVVCRNPQDPHRVCDELLRWHFRQSVLANLLGAGEPVFEHDFTGHDMVKEMSKGPYAKERFELELAARLYGVG
ncbi:HNH endonuclease-domain-containing protein [Kalaharituber pfeilii]|nr:HNH endonuclease-domain-containing protein [Kalaharituber pfeilii]